MYMQPSFSAQCPEDLLSITPFLLGFHPQDSVVILVIEGNVVAGGARMDIQDALEGRSESLLFPFMVGFDNPRVGVIGYGEANDATMAVQAVLEGLRRPSIMDVVVSDGQWWELEQPDFKHPYDPSSGRLAAEAAFQGIQARPSRADLEWMFERPPYVKPFSSRTLEAALRRTVVMNTQRQQRRFAALLDDALESATPGVSMPTGEQAELVALLQYSAIRDEFWMRLNQDNADKFVALWTHLAQRCPDEYAITVTAAAGIAAWQSRTATLVTIACERIDKLGGCEGNQLASLLNAIHVLALPPQALEEVQEMMRS